MCKNSGFRLRIQKSYNIFGIHSKFITPPLLPWAHTDRTDLTGFLCGWKISQRLSAPLLPMVHTDSTRFNEKIICGLNGLFLNNFTYLCQ